MSAHCDTGDWEYAIAMINLIISTTVWKGTGPITLNIYCNTHIDMNELDRTCGVHVTYPNLPLERQTVYNLNELISTTNLEILAVLSMICFNPSLRNIFDKTVDWLITADTKKKSAKKQTTSNIGAVEVKNGIGETGFHLQFHTGNECDRLYGAKRADLHNWRHYSSGKLFATGYPEGGGRGFYGGYGGRGRGCGGHGKGRGRGRENFES